MISFTRISKQYGRQVLFVEASFQLNPGERVGLVGPNGSGKTTLFRMIVGDEAPDEGEVTVPRKLTIGYFRQDVEEMSGRSVLDEAIAGSGRLGDLHHELEHLQQAMGDPRALTRWTASSSASATCRRSTTTWEADEAGAVDVNVERHRLDVRGLERLERRGAVGGLRHEAGDDLVDVDGHDVVRHRRTPRTVVEPTLCTEIAPFSTFSACFGSVVTWPGFTPLGRDFCTLLESNLSHSAPGRDLRGERRNVDVERVVHGHDVERARDREPAGRSAEETRERAEVETQRGDLVRRVEGAGPGDGEARDDASAGRA